MRESLPRLAISFLCLGLLAGIQWGLWTIFADEGSGPAVEIYAADLKKVRDVWAKEIKDEDGPEEKVRPIRDFFGAGALNGGSGTGGGPDDEDMEPPPPNGRMVIVSIAYPTNSGGIPIIWIEYDDVRDRYVPGDQLPDNTVLEGVERVAPGEYVVKRSRAGKPEKEGIPTYRLTGAVDR